ncbi:hypothetical protein ACWDXV_16470 [Nocardia nova]
MNWAQKLELIGSEHAAAVRDIRLRIERIDSDATQNNSNPRAAGTSVETQGNG